MYILTSSNSSRILFIKLTASCRFENIPEIGLLFLLFYFNQYKVIQNFGQLIYIDNIWTWIKHYAKIFGRLEFRKLFSSWKFHRKYRLFRGGGYFCWTSRWHLLFWFPSLCKASTKFTSCLVESLIAAKKLRAFSLIVSPGSNKLDIPSPRRPWKAKFCFARNYITSPVRSVVSILFSSSFQQTFTVEVQLLS